MFPFFGFIINIICQGLILLVIVSALSSWMDLSKAHPFVGWLNRCTEPLYKFVRPVTKNIPGPLDWAPLIICFFLMTLQRFLIPLL